MNDQCTQLHSIMIYVSNWSLRFNTMTGSLPDFRDRLFSNKELPKIHDALTFSSLQELFNQAKSNASLVPSTLGGGIHGHLGLLLSPIKYQKK